MSPCLSQNIGMGPTDCPATVGLQSSEKSRTRDQKNIKNRANCHENQKFTTESAIRF